MILQYSTSCSRAILAHGTVPYPETRIHEQISYSHAESIQDRNIAWPSERLLFQIQHPFFLGEVAGDIAPQYLTQTRKLATLFLDQVEQGHNHMEANGSGMNPAHGRDVLGGE